ncbi:MAG: ATP synthase F1 subunit gamma [Agathobacter sp.]|nr:ATP synthase F1 subunit gamma [Agathobacter sp.]
MASMRDIKRRKSSISSTQQITKAMKLVSTVKLQKAKTRAEQTDPYFRYMYKTVSSILAKSGNISHPYLTPGDSDRKAVVVLTSNRGLAGGYNTNVVKLITNGDFNKDELDIYAVGGKGQELLASKGYNIVESAPEVMENPTYSDAAELCNKVLESFSNGEVGEIYLAYTHFKNTVTQEAQLIKLLPVEIDDEEEDDSDDASVLMNYEPNEEEALDMIIPKYVTSLFYGALVESHASENGARMQAMDSATSNAEEMISDLTLKYNRARQGSITQELTEIIAGANAIS